MTEDYYGYRGHVAEMLRAAGAAPGDRIIVTSGGREYAGILMPRQALYGDKPFIVIKLDNGYNIGVRVRGDTSIRVVEKRGPRLPEKHVEAAAQPGLPRILLLGTGGTIMSRVDYETGAVKPLLSVADLFEWVPELRGIASIEAEEMLSIFSEDMEPRLWSMIAERVYKALTGGYEGVVIAHGTDTMAYTAAALAFAVQNPPSPIVLVGAQRSSDRPSTDSAFNLVAAFLTAARAPFAESVVVMHGETGDTVAYVHRGVKVRKMHTSRRDAFQSINDKPIAVVDPYRGEIRVTGRIIHRRGEGEPVLRNRFEEKVALVKIYPGMTSDVIDYYVDKGYRGIVLEGTGLGHAPNRMIDSIRRAVEEGVVVVMTSQCLFGRINMHVYATGRKLLAAGVVPGGDMLPETAYVKLSWVLGQTSSPEEARELIQRNMVGEYNPRHTVDMYPRWPI